MSKERIIVVDSSVIVKWVSRTKESHIAQANAIMNDLQQGTCTAYTSELSKYEVANALLKGKHLSVRHARQALSLLYSFPLIFLNDSEDISVLAYALAHDHDMTYYDAVFLALAKTVSVPLVTDNVRHQKPVSGVRVIPLAKYTSGLKT